MTGLRVLFFVPLVCSSYSIITKIQEKSPFGSEKPEGHNDEVFKTGYFPVECVQDEMLERGDKHGDNQQSFSSRSGVSIVRYDVALPKEKRDEMTVSTCYNYCRTVEGAHFFGLHNGRDCYCSPFYKPMAGDSSECDAPCDGDNKQKCGGKTKSSIYSMHNCGDEAAQAKMDAAVETMDKSNEYCMQTFDNLDTYVAVFDLAGKAVQEAAGANGDTVTADNGFAISSYSRKMKAGFDQVNAACQKIYQYKEDMQVEGVGLETTVKRETAMKEGLAIAKVQNDTNKQYDYMQKIKDRADSKDSKETFEKAQKAFFPASYFVAGDLTYHISETNAEHKHVLVVSSCKGKGEVAADPIVTWSESECAAECFANPKCNWYQSMRYRTDNEYTCQQFQDIDEMSYYTGKGCESEDNTDEAICKFNFAQNKGVEVRFSSKEKADYIKQNKLDRCWKKLQQDK